MLSSRIQKILLLFSGKLGVLEWILPGYALAITKTHVTSDSGFSSFVTKDITEKKPFTIVHNASPGKGAKAVLKIVGKDGKALAYIKIADNIDRGHFIKQENDNLKYLSKIDFKSAVVPEILSYQENRGHYILSLRPGEEKFKNHFSVKDHDRIVSFLVELFNTTSSRKLIRDTTFWKETNANFGKFRKGPLGRKYGCLSDMFFRYITEMEAEYFPFGMVHRDFVGWNIKRQRDGRLYVMDWEWGRKDYLPFQDLFHFVLLTEWANSKKSVLEVIRHDFFSRNASCGAAMRKYAENIGVPPKWSQHFFVLYLIEWTVFHLLNSNEVGQWAKEALSFLDRVREDRSFLTDNWLK